MSKKLKISFLVLVGLLVLLFVFSLPIFPFVPVYNIKQSGRDQRWCRMSSKLTDHALLAVRSVLADGFERFVYLRSMHQVLIPFQLFVDTEMLGNYTFKAGLVCPCSKYEMNPYGLWVDVRR